MKEIIPDLSLSTKQKIEQGIDKKIININNQSTEITYNCFREIKKKNFNFDEANRAAFIVELITKYKYSPKKIDLDVSVQNQTPKDNLDIVIYEDFELKHAYLIVKCEKQDVSRQRLEQTIENVYKVANNLKSKYFSVITENTNTIFNINGFKLDEKEKNILSDIPIKYGKVPKYKFRKKSSTDLKIVSKEDLIKVLTKTHDIVWEGGKRSPSTAFDEISKILFCKLKDEKETPKNKEYQFQIGTHETPEELSDRINSIYNLAKKSDPDVFREEIKISPQILYSVVENLQMINFNRTDLDAKGVAFETYLDEFFRGQMGQFFTPREIIEFTVKVINPKHDDTILDPACGSGGFLLNCMEHIIEYAEKHYDELESFKIWNTFAVKNLFGIEINDQIARICKMNMMLHGDGHSNIINTDALENFGDIGKINPNFSKNKFDIILTNPPFGAKLRSKEKNYFSDYELGLKDNAERNTQSTEILFIERCLDFLKPNGKMVIVLPDGILTNSTLQYVRDFVQKKAQITAIISLPDFTFTPYKAGVKSSLVFLRKKEKNEIHKDYQIFMAIAENIGYDSTGKSVEKNDLDIIYEEVKKFFNNPQEYDGMERGDG